MLTKGKFLLNKATEEKKKWKGLKEKKTLQECKERSDQECACKTRMGTNWLGQKRASSF